MAGRRWTPREDAELDRMRDAGASFLEIAASLGRTGPAVLHRLRDRGQLGVRTVRRIRYWRLLAVPHRTRDVAAAMGVSEVQVRKMKYLLKKGGMDVLRAAGRWGYGT